MRTIETLASTSTMAAVLFGIAMLTACQSLPSNSPMLEQARADYRAAEEDPHVRELAKRELRQASDAVNEADRAWAWHRDADEIEHLAYMAKQRIAIAREVAVGKLAEVMPAPSNISQRLPSYECPMSAPTRPPRAGTYGLYQSTFARHPECHP